MVIFDAKLLSNLCYFAKASTSKVKKFVFVFKKKLFPNILFGRSSN